MPRSTPRTSRTTPKSSQVRRRERSAVGRRRERRLQRLRVGLVGLVVIMLIAGLVAPLVAGTSSSPVPPTTPAGTADGQGTTTPGGDVPSTTDDTVQTIEVQTAPDGSAEVVVPDPAVPTPADSSGPAADNE
jgi:hypothetical protein